MSDESLADAFDIALPAPPEPYVDLDIPENPTLDDIAKLSLTVFQRLVGDTNDVPAQFRARHLEVSQSFINTAMSAIAKKEEIRVKDTKKRGEPPTSGQGVSRASLLGGGKK